MLHGSGYEVGTSRRAIGLLMIMAVAGCSESANARGHAPEGSGARPLAGAPFTLQVAGSPALVDDLGLLVVGAEALDDRRGTRVGWGRALGAPLAHDAVHPRLGDQIEVDLSWSVGVLAPHPDGVQQSWELAARPTTPALEVRVPVDDAVHLGRGEDGLVFRTTAGQYLLYGDAVWIDADGRETPVPARFDGAEIALTVPQHVLDESTYPALLDPIIGVARSLTPTQLTNANADQENPDIAVGATSRLIVWSDDRTGAVPGVFGTFRDDTGTLGERYSFRIGSSRLTGTPLAPSVAYADGIYLVAWATYDTVYAVRVAEGGGVLDATPLSVSTGGNTKGAMVTTDGAEFVVVWIEEGASAGVRARRVATDGSFPGPAFWVRQDTAGHFTVRAAHDPAGGYWVVFDDDSSGDRDVALVRLAADASVRDAASVALVSGFADQWSGDIAFASGGNAVVAYADSSTNAVHGLTVSEGVGGALSFGAPTRVSVGSGEGSPRIVHDGRSYQLGWISGAPGVPTAQVATIVGPTRMDGVSMGDGSSSRVALAVEASGTVHAVWQARNADTASVDLFRRARGASASSWGGETSLVSQAPQVKNGPVIANNNTRSLAAWVERTPGGARVYAVRINALGEFEDVAAFPVGGQSMDAEIVGVYSDGTGFLVYWQARDLRSFATGSVVVWSPTAARVSTGGVVTSPIYCGTPARAMNAVGMWLDRSVFPTRYVATYVDGDVIYNGPVGTTTCSGRFLYEDDAVVDAITLVPTPNAVYFVSSAGDLHRVRQSTEPLGGVGGPLGVGGSDLVTLDVLPGFPGSSDTVAYSSSPPRFPLAQDVGVVSVSAAGSIEWDLPDLAEDLETGANPQLTRFDSGTFVVWRQTDNSIVGQRFSTLGERVDPVAATIDAEPTARFLGDIVTDFLGRSMLVYSAVLPEQGWSTRIRTRPIDFRFDEGRALGETCATGFDCDSGHCADGVCCDSACGFSNPEDCQACSISAGAAADGTCSALALGAECRARADECDVAEVCDGVATACPIDSVAPADTACGAPADGACDLGDRCSGASVSCESRAYVPAGTVCRASRGGCDAEDVCDGSQGACLDAVRPSGAVCRASVGACDVEETCDGSTDACPVDMVEVAGVECRRAIGGCDVVETCNGTSGACPADVVLAATLVCRAATGVCDREERCDGSGGSCPPDAFLGEDTECRAAETECDVAEYCDGSSSTCGADAALADGTACGADGLACEVASCRAGACVSEAVVCDGGAACSEAAGGCTPPTVDPEPTPPGCGCRAGDARGSGLAGAIGALMLALLGRRRK